MSKTYTLDPQTASFVDAEVARGRYISPADLLQQAVRLLECRDLRKAHLDAMLDKGLADIESGLVYDADDVFDELETRYSSPEAFHALT